MTALFDRPAASLATGPIVLLADDDDDARDLVANAVREAGFVVHDVHDGAELLLRARALLHDGQRIALVLSDINMPAPDGLEVTPQLLALEPSLHIVLMSAFADASIMGSARAAGARRILRKPFALGAVLQILATLGA